MSKCHFLVLFALLSFGCLFPNDGFAQEESNNSKGIIVSTKLGSLILGGNIGVETPLSQKVSLAGEVTYHGWIESPNIAVTPSVKYYFKQSGKGLYLRAKLVGGYFFSKTAVDNKPYYAGGGIGIGGLYPLFKGKRFCIFAEIGLKYVAPFGNRPNSNVKDGEAGMAYYSLMSPASIPDAAIGFAIKF